jgi:phosphopantetheine adenylyltransferase
MHRRYDFAKWTVAPVVWIASTYIPLKAIAGHKTILNVSFSITIVVSIVTGASLLTMYLRARKAEEANEELHDTIRELEGAREGVTA